ncbi:MAG TPA: glycosyltransferase family 2 protein [Candidatus Sulfotelmatobacter sp.]|nr:glycosyltransferase family 2 protein [Candidatus Sulfotelmatobacter sp.]
MRFPPLKYVLISSARNEGQFIAKTLESVAAQTQLPERWVVVDDGSTDNTAEIAAGYAERFSWITLVRNPRREGRNLASKANNVNGALARLANLDFDVVGNLDADTSFEPVYMEFLMRAFAQDAKLGVAGTPFTQDGGYDSTRDSFEGENYVAGPVQLFRRECWSEIGGYSANPVGGMDWIAVLTARMKGWTVRSFADMRYHHHRSMGTAERSDVAAQFSYGQKDYYLGNSPIWQLFRVTYRLSKKPYIAGGSALLFGYCLAAMRRPKRPISDELLRFHRGEQMKKLKAICGSLLQFKSPDNFRLATKSAAKGIPITQPVVDTPVPMPRQRE